MQPDLARQRIDLLIQLLLQIDDAVDAEAVDGPPDRGVERDHLIPGRDVDDALLLAVGPVRQAAPRELPRRRFAAFALVEAVDPELFTGCGVERNDGTTAARRRIEDPVGDERRRLELKLGPRSQIVGLEPPRDFERAEVLRVDLIERRVTRVSEIAAVGPPLAVGGAALRGRAWPRR